MKTLSYTMDEWREAMNQLKLFIALTLFFIVLTEKILWLNALAGLMVSALVMMLNRDSFPDFRKVTFKSTYLWFKFLIVLIKEVIISNLQVAGIVLSRKMAVNAIMHPHQSRLQDTLLLTIYANAITLTPGTMTVDIDGQRLSIHCLNESYAEGIENNTIERILLEIEGEWHE